MKPGKEFYELYSIYIKQNICNMYIKNPFHFLYNVETILSIQHEITSENDILFYAYNGTFRIEILAKDKEVINVENLKCRILDYEQIWEDKKWNDKYIICSDMDYDKEHIID